MALIRQLKLEFDDLAFSELIREAITWHAAPVKFHKLAERENRIIYNNGCPVGSNAIKPSLINDVLR